MSSVRAAVKRRLLIWAFPFLGRIPLDPDVVTQSDAGEPFALFNSDSATAQAYHDIANQVEAFCKKSGSLVKLAPRQQH
jgi:ATP-binding protein involved in chromosome partitioning